MIKQNVRKLIETHGTSNPFLLCDYLDIKIIKSNLGNEIKGFFQRTPSGHKIIHINSSIDENEMKYICAHELGHAVLHTNVSIALFIENPLQIKNKYEIEADKFAAELLIDIETDAHYYKDMTIKQLSFIFHVPVDLLKYKYHLLCLFFVSNSLIFNIS